MLQKLGKQILKWFRNIFRGESVFRPEFVDDLPETLKSHTVYLVQNEDYVWQAVFACPCNCGQLVYLNLINDYSPSWKVVVISGKVSVEPSIDRLVGCRSHFFIKEGRTIWC